MVRLRLEIKRRSVGFFFIHLEYKLGGISSCYIWNTSWEGSITPLTLIGNSRRPSWKSLLEECQLVGLLSEWLWDWTAGIIGNGVFLGRSDNNYIGPLLPTVE